MRSNDARPTPYPVTVSTDFGAHYPGAMRGVLAGRGITAIYDVSHDLPAHDTIGSAFWLRSLLPYFPPAVHCVVVDPGVGADRDVVAIAAGGHALIGPDNGVLIPPAERLADDAEIEVFALEHVDPPSATFHGRDVFAPFAAAIAHLGVDRIGALPTADATTAYERVDLPAPTVTATGIETVVVAVDRFGTAITTCPGHHLDDRTGTTVYVDGKAVPVTATYADVGHGVPLVTIGSHGYVELAANRSRGVDAFDVAIGDRVEIRF